MSHKEESTNIQPKNLGTKQVQVSDTQIGDLNLPHIHLTLDLTLNSIEFAVLGGCEWQKYCEWVIRVSGGYLFTRRARKLNKHCNAFWPQRFTFYEVTLFNPFSSICLSTSPPLKIKHTPIKTCFESKSCKKSEGQLCHFWKWKTNTILFGSDLRISSYQRLGPILIRIQRRWHLIISKEAATYWWPVWSHTVS